MISLQKGTRKPISLQKGTRKPIHNQKVQYLSKTPGPPGPGPGMRRRNVVVVFKRRTLVRLGLCRALPWGLWLY